VGGELTRRGKPNKILGTSMSLSLSGRACGSQLAACLMGGKGGTSRAIGSSGRSASSVTSKWKRMIKVRKTAKQMGFQKGSPGNVKKGGGMLGWNPHKNL